MDQREAEGRLAHLQASRLLERLTEDRQAYEAYAKDVQFSARLQEVIAAMDDVEKAVRRRLKELAEFAPEPTKRKK